MVPGETRIVGASPLTSEGAEMMRAAKKFYLWDGRFIGEATITAEHRPAKL
jgi:hypothetical protein